MHGLSTIIALNEQASRKAQASRKMPYVVIDQARIAGFPPFPFPHLGYDDPPGWKFMDKVWFVDSTGLDTSGPALSVESFKAELRGFLAEFPEEEWLRIGFGITEVGPFQLHVGAFRRTI